MSKDQVIGVLLLIASIIGIIVYGYLIYMYPMIIMQITLFIAVAAVGLIVAWIGYTLATTPPPKPIEEIEKEIEKELKTLEEEKKKEEEKTEEKK
ncbi:MAG: transcriptional regulator [Candidatus Methanomethylicia archaeon]|nr:transcriptional regulator [Candidatus Methanomethylicia archaeon]